MSQKGLCGRRIHSSPLKGVSGAIFEWAPSQFSLTVYESTKAVGADESIRHMRKEFRGQLLSGQRVSFPLLFMSHQGLFGMTNPFATCESSFRVISEWAASQFSLTVYESTGLCGLTNPFVTCVKSFDGDF